MAGGWRIAGGLAMLAGGFAGLLGMLSLAPTIAGGVVWIFLGAPLCIAGLLLLLRLPARPSPPHVPLGPGQERSLRPISAWSVMGLLTTAFAGSVLAYGAAALGASPSPPLALTSLFAALALVMLAACGTFLARMARVRIRVSNAGIDYRGWKKWNVTWSQVQGLTDYDAPGQRNLYFHLADRQRRIFGNEWRDGDLDWLVQETRRRLPHLGVLTQNPVIRELLVRRK